MGSIFSLPIDEEEKIINVGGCFFPESVVDVVLTSEELKEILDNSSENYAHHRRITKKTKTKSCLPTGCKIIA